MVPLQQHGVVTGEEFRRLVEAGARCLETNVDAINALNVFPVPDGDTGINMLLTLKAALAFRELPGDTGTVAEVSHALARGALLGARGNSGVIFSQFMKGLSLGLAHCDDCQGVHIRNALVAASAAGYQAVGKPVEGTMLTVMRAAAERVRDLDASADDVLREALDAAEQALAHTPEQLPVLKEAGVVDAGGQGVVAFLAGALAYLEGYDPAIKLLEAVDGAQPPAAVSREFLQHSEDEMYGYCTQFIILGEGLDVGDVREQVMAIAGSTVVIGDDRAVRVHAHAADPGPLLSLGAARGALDQIKIENMDAQHQGFMALHGYSPERKALAVVAVAPGKGLGRVFRELGALVVPGGQTMNPSARDLLDAVERANAEQVVILPNNGNIVMAARQAAELKGDGVVVVPSRSIPQGIAALFKLSPDLSAQENTEAMLAALNDVRSGEVTTAVRSTTVDGILVRQGQAMALLDDSLVGTAETPLGALVSLVERAAPEPGALVTLYHGKDVTAEEAMEAAASLAERFPDIETEVVEGGQPHYQYIVSIE